MLDFAKSTWRNLPPLLLKKKQHSSAPYHQCETLPVSRRIAWYLARGAIERGDEYVRLGFSLLCEHIAFLAEDVRASLVACHDK